MRPLPRQRLSYLLNLSGFPIVPSSLKLHSFQCTRILRQKRNLNNSASMTEPWWSDAKPYGWNRILKRGIFVYWKKAAELTSFGARWEGFFLFCPRRASSFCVCAWRCDGHPVRRRTAPVHKRPLSWPAVTVSLNIYRFGPSDVVKKGLCLGPTSGRFRATGYCWGGPGPASGVT